MAEILESHGSDAHYWLWPLSKNQRDLGLLRVLGLICRA